MQQYWSVRESAANQKEPSYFHAHSGKQDASSDKGCWLFALAVRDGDVAVELATYALMLAGLGTLAVARRRRSV